LNFSQYLFFSQAAFSGQNHPDNMPSMGTRVKSRLKKPTNRRHFIREWRKHRGLTQPQLAERIGVSVSSISQLETYKQGYSQATLEALADALNCEPADLLIRDPLSREGIWSIWESLEQPAREQVTEIAKTFRKAS
jgi:transcriptional regulator with XRE-family HTH domain